MWSKIFICIREITVTWSQKICSNITSPGIIIRRLTRSLVKIVWYTVDNHYLVPTCNVSEHDLLFRGKVKVSLVIKQVDMFLVLLNLFWPFLMWSLLIFNWNENSFFIESLHHFFTRDWCFVRRRYYNWNRPFKRIFPNRNTRLGRLGSINRILITTVWNHIRGIWIWGSRTTE